MSDLFLICFSDDLLQTSPLASPPLLLPVFLPASPTLILPDSMLECEWVRRARSTTLDARASTHFTLCGPFHSLWHSLWPARSNFKLAVSPLGSGGRGEW